MLKPFGCRRAWFWFSVSVTAPFSMDPSMPSGVWYSNPKASIVIVRAGCGDAYPNARPQFGATQCLLSVMSQLRDARQTRKPIVRVDQSAETELSPARAATLVAAPLAVGLDTRRCGSCWTCGLSKGTCEKNSIMVGALTPASM